ncbi:MAG TPA: hypothetical protein ENI76_06255 [Ignavibacteria bacterium]|nr:hypothetical protein [Ignavibacteria bacterium]
MTYKTYLKNNDEITIKLRIIKQRVVDKEAINSISSRYSMHRNSVRNVITLYKTQASIQFKEKIQNNVSFSKTELIKL